MKHGRRIPDAAALGLAGIALAVILPHCLLLPESGLVGENVSNRKPQVQITGGVLEDSVGVEARVHFFWFGADDDGVVRWFEYAVDDTVSEQAWRRTTRFDAAVSFTARSYDQGERFADWHTFYIRAVDDDFSRSNPDKRYFNAGTVAPMTEIIRPIPRVDARWASTIRITWQGEDPDGSRADRLPAYFEYKQLLFQGTVNLGDVEALRRAFEDSSNVLLDSLRREDYPTAEYFRSGRRAWVRVPGTTTSVWLENMAVGKKYGFVVRAIDESGAVEPNLEWGNYVVFDVLNQNITVFLSEQGLGTWRFNSPDYSTQEVSVAPMQRIRFRWSGDATDSGSEPGPSNYGFDIPDPASEDDRAVDGQGGWIGWGDRSQMQNSVFYAREDEGETHHFYLKMRDISRSEATETRCHLELTVARLSFIRKFLMVDDLRFAPRGCQSGTYPTDAQADAFLRRVTSGIREFLPPGEEPGTYDVFRAGDSESAPAIPDAFLDTLGTYQNIIWDCGEILGQDSRTGLYNAGTSRGDLARYRGAGGNLLLTVYRGPVTVLTAGSFSEAASSERCPFEGFSTIEPWTRFSFMWQGLHLRGCVDKPRTNMGRVTQERNSLVAARAENGLYQDLTLNWTAWGCTSRGLIEYECLWTATRDPDEIPWYEREEGMEILYRAETYRVNQRFSGLPIAWRTFATREDSLQGIAPGRMVVFAFHPYYMNEAGVEQAMTLALQWLATGSEF
jgi:hypothetical protein